MTHHNRALLKAKRKPVLFSRLDWEEIEKALPYLPAQPGTVMRDAFMAIVRSINARVARENGSNVFPASEFARRRKEDYPMYSLQ